MATKCTCNSDAYHSWYAKKQKTFCFRCNAYVDSENIDGHEDLCVDNKPLVIPDVLGLPAGNDDIPWHKIPLALIRKYGWYVSDFIDYKLTFLVLPVYRDGKMVFWTARNLESDEPKYLSAHGSRKQCWLSDEQYPTGDLFIAESIADACYLSQLGQSVGLLGTSYNGSLDNWMKSATRIIISFDGDSVGRVSSLTLAKYLREKQICKRIYILPIPMSKDPVDMSLLELRELVKELT